MTHFSHDETGRPVTPADYGRLALWIAAAIQRVEEAPPAGAGLAVFSFRDNLRPQQWAAEALAIEALPEGEAAAIAQHWRARANAREDVYDIVPTGYAHRDVLEAVIATAKPTGRLHARARTVLADLDRLTAKMSLPYVQGTIAAVFAPAWRDSAGHDDGGYWLRGEWVR